MKRPAKLLYQANKTSYQLAMLMIVFNTIYTIEVLNRMRLGTQVGSVTLFNIVLSLFMFLAAVKTKTYHFKWSVITLLLGLSYGIRLFTLPNAPSADPIYLRSLLIIAGISGTLAGLIAIKKCRIRQNLITQENIQQTHFAK